MVVLTIGDGGSSGGGGGIAYTVSRLSCAHLPPPGSSSSVCGVYGWAVRGREVTEVVQQAVHSAALTCTLGVYSLSQPRDLLS